jgi:hypothetical protein
MDTIESPALTEDLLLVLDNMEDAVIPCTKGPGTLTWDEAGGFDFGPDTAICGRPATWVNLKPCGHQGYTCDMHYEPDVPPQDQYVCRVCRHVCWADQTVWRRL